jgi:hypothetical protein
VRACLTGQHRYDGPCSDWRTCWLNWLYPVRVKTLAPVRLTFADYMAGRDPPLDPAMALARPR